ncbi:hypothetical protein EON63_03390 [archaeon]|nr:MAG: hypothetical protein EON63_03390 [archaeon]
MHTECFVFIQLNLPNHISPTPKTLQVPFPSMHTNREVLTNVARTSLRSKLSMEVADKMSDAVVEAVLAIAEPEVWCTVYDVWCMVYGAYQMVEGCNHTPYVWCNVTLHLLCM